MARTSSDGDYYGAPIRSLSLGLPPSCYLSHHKAHPPTACARTEQPHNRASFQPAPWRPLGARGVLTGHLQGKEAESWGAAPLTEGRERGETRLPGAAFGGPRAAP